MDVGYNIGSFSLSAPQTTQRRIMDTEGEQETPREAMQWVWISTWKMLVYTAIPSILGRTIWPFIGGLLVIADVHGSYRYAIACGKRALTPGGRLVDQARNGYSSVDAPTVARPR
jgi:hypothetical protein